MARQRSDDDNNFVSESVLPGALKGQWMRFHDR
jgi:hypothetical protein